MAFKAVFFDRDGTLAYNDPMVIAQLNSLVISWGGKPFPIGYDKMLELFHAASQGAKPWYKNVEDERAFFHRYYQLMLKEFGLWEHLDERATQILKLTWLRCLSVYPDVIGVLTYFQSQGYKMGVISNTSPSLELTLAAVGLDSYFTSYTASSLAGASKPSPNIFNAALAAHGVTPGQSLFVDDDAVNTDAAREQGFTAFLIDRESKHQGEWVIRSLMEMVDFVQCQRG